MRNKLRDILHKDKRAVYFYANGHFIKKTWLYKSISKEEMSVTPYCVNVYFKKYLLGSNFCKVVIIPKKLKLEEENGDLHLEAVLYEGTDI